MKSALLLLLATLTVSCAPKAIVVDPVTPHVAAARVEVAAAAAGL